MKTEEKKVEVATATVPHISPAKDTAVVLTGN